MYKVACYPFIQLGISSGKVKSKGVASPRQLKGSNHPVHRYPAQEDVRINGVQRSIIEGVQIHIFVFCIIKRIQTFPCVYTF